MSTSEPPRSPALTARYGDTGLQHERTDLAWTRTAIAFGIVGGLLLRAAPRMTWPAVGSVLGFGVLAISAAVLLGRHHRYQRRDGALHADDPVAIPQSMRRLAQATTFAALAAFAGVVLLVAR